MMCGKGGRCYPSPSLLRASSEGPVHLPGPRVQVGCPVMEQFVKSVGPFLLENLSGWEVGQVGLRFLYSLQASWASPSKRGSDCRQAGPHLV